MKPLKPMIILGSVLFILTLVIPTLLVIPFTEETKGSLIEDIQPQVLSTPEVKNSIPVSVPVYREEKDVIEEIPIEQYVIGVVASEMPAEFEMEALKAQAIAARTYIVQQLLSDKRVRTPEGSKVTDTVKHQRYKDYTDLKEDWNSDFTKNLEKITKAVNETEGQIITYDGEPIDASYFSTSNGFTENSEDYWSYEYPYLRSVQSSWGEDQSPKYIVSTTIPVSDFQSKLGVSLGNSSEIGTITARTKGNRVGSVQIAGKTFTGKEVRELLGLYSSDFTWERKGNQIIITTKGYGHGVGMSQYGANGMAKQGKTYQEIVTHYYQGIEITNLSPYLDRLTAYTN
ncbi:stage II sporulation protein D [Bacillus sp. AK128]